jgi:virginiamycin B lyase
MDPMRVPIGLMRALQIAFNLISGLWLILAPTLRAEPLSPQIREYPLPSGSHPHDVAPDADGTIWYTAQGSGELGRIDPRSGNVRRIALGEGSRPHGVIIGPDGAPWITDGGLHAIVRFDPKTEKITLFPLPADKSNANLNTAVFDSRGHLWFTGQGGYYGKLVPRSGQIELFESPKGTGPYGITSTPDGAVYFASLAGNYIARVDSAAGAVSVIEPATPRQGARRIWSDSAGILWVSEWNAGQLGRYDPSTRTWTEWKLPGKNPAAYAVFADGHNGVWLSDFTANTLVRFDPATKRFASFSLPTPNAQVRQLAGREGEVWGAESRADKLVVIQVR